MSKRAKLSKKGVAGKPTILDVIIETPKGSRNKFKYDSTSRMFKLSKVLPEGMMFPYDFGFVPSSTGGDGDPLDVLVLMDEPTFPGCLLECRLIGVIEAEQVQDCGVQVVDVDFVVDGGEAKLVGGADHLPALDAAAGEPHRKAVMIVVAAAQGRQLSDRRAAELTTPHHERLVK